MSFVLPAFFGRPFARRPGTVMGGAGRETQVGRKLSAVDFRTSESDQATVQSLAAIENGLSNISAKLVVHAHTSGFLGAKVRRLRTAIVEALSEREGTLARTLELWPSRSATERQVLQRTVLAMQELVTESELALNIIEEVSVQRARYRLLVEAYGLAAWWAQASQLLDIDAGLKRVYSSFSLYEVRLDLDALEAFCLAQTRRVRSTENENTGAPGTPTGAADPDSHNRLVRTHAVRQFVASHVCLAVSSALHLDRIRQKSFATKALNEYPLVEQCLRCAQALRDESQARWHS